MSESPDVAPSAAPITLFVCTTCRRKIDGEGEAFDLPGAGLAADLAARVSELGIGTTITVAPVECLSVCKRPATIALQGHGRWSYVIADIDAALHIDDIIAGARAYAASANGITPWRERPQIFRKGVVARIPPPGFKSPEPAP